MANLRGNNLPKVKQQNLAAIREIILRYGPISRSEIAERMELTPATITNNVNELIVAGLVEECCAGAMESGRTIGRRPVLIDFKPDAGVFIGIELGRRSTLLCAVDLRGREKARLELEMPPRQYDGMIAMLSEAVSELIRSCGMSRSRVLGVGVALPGAVDGFDGLIRSNTRTDWNGHAIGLDLAKALELPVSADNNVRARAFGVELFHQELLQNTETFAYYFIAMGIACPLFIKNAMFSGVTAGAGEVGHMIMEIDGPKCETCGNLGCLEAFASERAILTECRKLLESGKPTLLADGCANRSEPTIDEVLAAQRQGDPAIEAIVGRAITYLGVSMANIINFINPHKMLVDGKLLNHPENRELLLKTAQRNLFGLNATEVEIVFVDYDAMSGAIGAAAMAIKKFFISS